MKALFYKEWIKTRWYLMAALIVSVAFCIYCLLFVSRVMALKGAVHIWEVILTRDAVFIQTLQFVPLIMAILFAIVQFVPEMQQKRIKLTLHLPLAQNRVIGNMLAFGSMALLAIFAIHFTLLTLFLTQAFAMELVSRILLTAAVWYIAGAIAYLLTAWICLEPTWKRRTINLLLSVAIIRVLFLTNTPEAYNDFLPMLLIYTLSLAALPLWSVQRFKHGKQD